MEPWQGTALIARHVSPDGALTLRVHSTEESDGTELISLGFEEDPWHMHPARAEAEAIVQGVLADRLVIVTTTAPGWAEVALLDDLEFEVDHAFADAAYSFRLWSREVSFEDLADGTVPYTPLRDLWNWCTE